MNQNVTDLGRKQRTTLGYFTTKQRDTDDLTAENNELKLLLQALEQQLHLQEQMNEAMKEEIKHLKVLTGQAIQNGGPMMNFPASYGANQQHYPNNHAMNTMLTAQQFRQLQINYQFQEHQLRQFQQQRSALLQQALDLKPSSSVPAPIEKENATSDAPSKD
ncbi:probable transcription factor PosF21 [Olea europaea var. sylvestris]|uniref:probable transcription factor PosF21 n=1 Tax=Olea europaea var. sylvestris TaxID=158386 RepID=UPI000C1D36B2|nr:probable transcription factor PosF21 [Olea europaea var. sylvestris]